MSEQIKIQNKEVTLNRLTLRGWAGLEGLKGEMDSATSKGDFEGIFGAMVKFIEMVISPSEHGVDWGELPWYDFVTVYSMAVRTNSPTMEFPILRASGGDEKKMPWEYDGRAWYFWLNLFASAYGWNSDTVSMLDIDDAIALYQEIEIERQLGREWEWGLSEIAYPYNKSTKKSEYKALPRPNWMLPIVPKQLPVVKMKKSFLPVGNVVDLQEQESQRREEKKKSKRGI